MDDQSASDLLERVEEENELFQVDIVDLNKQVKLLQEYREECRLNKPVNESGMIAGENSVKSAFESMMKMIPNDLILVEKHLNEQFSYNDEVFIPHNSGIMTEKCHCPGCGIEFKRNSETLEPAYFIHCTKECEEYSQLNLAEKCLVCKKLFIKESFQGNHQCHRPPKPYWMTACAYRHAFGKQVGLKPCPGCGKHFPIVKGGNQSFEFLIHVVEQCSRCENVVKECKECNFKFVTNEALSRHITARHPSMKKPEWIAETTFVRGKIASRRSNVSTACCGCGKELKKLRGSYRLEDYIHMIEECEKYKKLRLITTCNLCKCKFINKNAYTSHKC